MECRTAQEGFLIPLAENQLSLAQTHVLVQKCVTIAQADWESEHLFSQISPLAGMLRDTGAVREYALSDLCPVLNHLKKEKRGIAWP